MWGLGVLIPLLGASALRVIQEPGEVRVAAGDTVALRCRVEEAESRAQLRMEWLRDGGLGVLCATRLRFVTPRPLSPCPARAPGAQLAWHPPRATLSLPQVRGNDSGRYLCRVTLEIPRYGTATGNGTELSVTPAAVGGHQAALLWGLLGGLGGPALVLGMALLGYRCCHGSSGPGGQKWPPTAAAPPDTPIYMNVAFRARDHTKLRPPPGLKNNLYQQELRRAQGPSLPPRL